MRFSEIINEAMSFNPSKLNIRDGGKYLDWVFPDLWTKEYDWTDIPYNSDEEPKENPEYRPDLDLNLSNDNMRDLMGQLGYEFEDSTLMAPIDEFITRAQNWLKQHVDKPSGGRDSYEEPREISGKNINYDFIKKKLEKEKTEELLASPDFQREIDSTLRLVQRPNVAQHWKDLYPNRDAIVKHKLARWVDSYVEAEVHRLKQQNEKPVGPRMIQGSRADNYFNKNIMKALKIAQKGKEMGADYISIA